MGRRQHHLLRSWPLGCTPGGLIQSVVVGGWVGRGACTWVSAGSQVVLCTWSAHHLSSNVVEGCVSGTPLAPPCSPPAALSWAPAAAGGASQM